MLHVFIAIATVQKAAAWDGMAHCAAARIAWQYLTPDAKNNIDLVLSGQPWLETTEIGRAARTPDFLLAHELRLPNDVWEFAYNALSPSGEHGRCDKGRLEETLVEAMRRVAYGRLTKREAGLYLCLIIKSIPEVHQPLHCITYCDAGVSDHYGTKTLVRYPRIGVRGFQGEGTSSLHGLWDGVLDFRIGNNLPKFMREVQDSPNPEPVPHFAYGSFDFVRSWVEESVEVGRDYAYGPIIDLLRTRAKQPFQLDQDYMVAALAVSEERLLTGALRLAGVLNLLYGPHYQPPLWARP